MNDKGRYHSERRGLGDPWIDEQEFISCFAVRRAFL
jgi:hypothetical protein